MLTWVIDNIGGICGIIISLLFLLLSIYCFRNSRNEDRCDRNAGILWGVLSLLTGVWLAVCTVFAWYKVLVISIAFYPFVLSVCFALEQYANRKNCSVPISAKYIGYDRSSDEKKYIPIFKYTFEGETYEQKSILQYPEKVLHALFVEMEEYMIYINPKVPRRCIDKRWIPRLKWTIELVVMLFYLAVGILVCIKLNAGL